MDAFVLGEDHRAFQRTVRDLARTEFLPGYRERAAREQFPYQEVKRLASAGLLALTLDEDRGGQGADLLALGLASEEVGYADPNLGYVLFATNVLVTLLAGHPRPAPACRRHSGTQRRAEYSPARPRDRDRASARRIRDRLCG